MNSPDPVPSYFGLRYIVWLIWTNLVTIIAIVQGTFAVLALSSEDMFSHTTVRWFMVASAVLSAVIAQIKKNVPPSPPPTKGP